jgi:DNA-binding response OmpR family regulator
LRHLLLVEDDPDVRSVLKLGLESDGECRASTAANIDEAQVVLCRDRPDAAIVDALLCGGSGLTLATHVLELGIPVLVMTGDPATQQQLTALECPFLAKPFHLHELRSRALALFDDTARNLRRMSALKDSLTKRQAALAQALSASRETLQMSRENRAERARRDTSE